MNRLHVLLMIPAVFALWMAGAIGLMFVASAVNVPGVNEHGSGAILLLGALAVALAGATIHIVVNLVGRRNRDLDAVRERRPLSSIALAGCGVAAIGIGVAIIVMVARSQYGDPTVLLISALLAIGMIAGGFVLFYTGVHGVSANKEM